MPYRTEWVEPEVFVEHRGTVVYHAYEDQDADRPLWFHYALPDEDAPDGCEFDISDLNCTGLDLKNRKHHKQILKRAIERKEWPFTLLVKGLVRFSGLDQSNP